MNYLKNIHLLIVEDDEVAADFLASSLEDIFKKIYIKNDGASAFEFIENNKIDALITDLAMPNMQGITLIKKLRENEKNKGNKTLPIIVISGRKESDELVEIVRYNLIDYIVKPFTFKRLYEMLERLSKSLIENNRRDFYIDNARIYDPTTKSIKFENKTIPLTSLEAHLLELLLENRGTLLPKSTIMEQIYPSEINDSAFRNLLVRLRKKVGKENILTKRDLGLLLK